MKKTYKNTNFSKVVNNTKKWAVLVDQFVGFFDTKEEAESISKLIDCIDSSPFGSFFILQPGYRYKDIYGYEEKLNMLSDVNGIDIKQYIEKNINKPMPKKFYNTAQKYYAEKYFNEIFEDENFKL